MRGIRLLSVTLICITFCIDVYGNNVSRVVHKVKYNDENNCDASDKLLFQQKAMLCGSLVQAHTWWCGDLWKNVTSKPSCDWPSQVVYFQDILNKDKNTFILSLINF